MDGRVTVWWDEHSDPANKGWVCEYEELHNGYWHSAGQYPIDYPRPNWRAACREALRVMSIDPNEVGEPVKADRPDVEAYVMETV